MSVAETLAPGVNTSSLLHPVFARAFRAHVQLRRSALTGGRRLILGLLRRRAMAAQRGGIDDGRATPGDLKLAERLIVVQMDGLPAG
jgi:hypothetical protein